MFELKDLPSRETLEEFSKHYDNPDVDGVYTWLVWASATDEMLSDFNANLLQVGLTQTSFFVLVLLKRNPNGLTIGELADRVAVASQTMTRAINKMVLAGQCTKHPAPNDGRLSIVKLAPQGEALLSDFLPQHYAWVCSIMRELDESERDNLIQLMMKVSSIIRKNRIKVALA